MKKLGMLFEKEPIHAVNLMPALAMRPFYKAPPRRLGLWAVLVLSNMAWIGIACLLWGTTWTTAKFSRTVTEFYITERSHWSQIQSQKDSLIAEKSLEVARMVALQTSSPGNVVELASKISKVLNTADGRNRTFLEKALPEAIRIQVQYGIPASATLSQAIYESHYGGSDLATQAHNYFGIKAFSSWNGPKVNMPTKDSGVQTTADFRSYKDVGEGFQGYADYLRENDRYNDAFYTKSGAEFVEHLLKDGYCPDAAYATDIKNIMARHNLQELDTIIEAGAKEAAPYHMAWNKKEVEIPTLPNKIPAPSSVAN